MKLNYTYLFLFLTSIKNLYGSTEIDTTQKALILTASKVTRSYCFKHKFPPLNRKKDITARDDMLDRIEMLFGKNLSANPNFHKLIDPLINIKPDAKGKFWVSFIVSDNYLSCLKIYEGFKFFNYDEVLAELEKSKGLERYKFGIVHMSSLSVPMDLSKKFWRRIFSLEDDRFEKLKSITQMTANIPVFNALVLPKVFSEIFNKSNWDETYWNRFSSLLSQVEPEIEKADDRTQVHLICALLQAADTPSKGEPL
ncbi:hypothetical protein [Candidatus Finniella inopinata]|uniref:Uncharacterized protein n=1 Tax=Candidatus Finniella inopinata TaxID=1696036 RepID=A0A4Q7DJV4_9PROT|nr:hypothetical protein [Candidatus Finniella inopinata]RZI47032.1 hypothetical protein EQU50_00130 [Candidatus Finniella inopinata]